MAEPEQESKPKKPKETAATIITIGIVIGFLIILFAVTIILINLIPIEDKLQWLLEEATIGNWILLVGAGLLEFFFALTVSIYIWKKGRSYLVERI